MKTTSLLIFVVMMIAVALSSAWACADEGYLYDQPSAEQLQEIQLIAPPGKQRSKPPVYPVHPFQACGNAARTTYHANRPQPRRTYKHQEVQVDSSFFEPSPDRIEELKRILLDRQ